RAMVHSSYARENLDQLEETFAHLSDLGVEDAVQLDLGLLRGFDYYTGIVFEGYTTDLGFTICGGGRYDNLLGKFGFPCPAIGFALGLDRLLLALSNRVK
ncbi:MAG: ATP phosphoribosyltransferase regulatory subunit, partial [Syntrophomonadaceae bacterium]|nr:ATP phosphoribosyltransferase regulatory subunit [Syntrophomonadaceae bacterium]